MPWTDIIPLVLDVTEDDDLVVYGGGVRISDRAVRTLRARGLKSLRDDCHVQFWHDRHAGKLALVLTKERWDGEGWSFPAAKTSYGTRDASLKFTSQLMARKLRQDGDRCVFKLSEETLPGFHAIFDLVRKLDPNRRRYARRMPRTVQHGRFTFTEVLDA